MPKRMTEVARFTMNVDAMADFYESLFGAPDARWPDGAVFHCDEVVFLIHRAYVAADGELPAENHVAFTVRDVDAEHSRLGSRGVKEAFAPADYDWGRSAYYRDPDGNLIEIAEQPDDE